LKDNSDFLQVNTLFKKIKSNFDEIKIILNDLDDTKNAKEKIRDIKMELLEKENRRSQIETYVKKQEADLEIQ
jgi:hypothetical protein